MTEGPYDYLDGMSKGCRILHSGFVAKGNSDHCPHLSFVPIPDKNNQLKCQATAWETDPPYGTNSMMGEADKANFELYMNRRGFDAALGVKLTPVDSAPKQLASKAASDSPSSCETSSSELPGWALALIITLAVLAFLAWAYNLRSHVMQQAQDVSATVNTKGIELKVAE